MKFDDIKNLSLQELENLLAARYLALEVLRRYEKEILAERGRRVFEHIINDTLDDIVLIQSLIKKLDRP